MNNDNNDNNNNDLTEQQRRGREFRDRAREQRSRERKAAQVVVSAYHTAKGLASLMSLLMFDLNSLPEGERATIEAASVAALNAFSLLDSITMDAGNCAMNPHHQDEEN